MDARFFATRRRERPNAFAGSYNKLHNGALKWWRDIAEQQGHNQVRFGTEAFEIPECNHQKGTDYDFKSNRTVSWSWMDMMMHLEDESFDLVLSGLGSHNCRSRGVVGCNLVRVPMHDHTRQRALRERAANQNLPPPADMLLQWYFAITCADDTRVFLKPNWSDRRIDAFMTAPGEDVLENLAVPTGPRGGPGGTEGPGTFRRFSAREASATHMLKFRVRVNS